MLQKKRNEISSTHRTKLAAILQEKAYSQYRTTRDEMRELQIHKAKVDEILRETSKQTLIKRDEKSK